MAESAKARKTTSGNEIDLEEAKRFLEAIGDEENEFQVFAEVPGADIKPGGGFDTLEKAAPVLAELNQEGAGIFVTINRMDGEGRKKKNVVAARALLLDLDGSPLEPVIAHELRPHIIIETSPDRYQCWYLLDPDEFPLNKWPGAQLGLAAKFGGDTALKTPERCGRLPGFWHQKGEPFRSRIIETNDGPPYTAEQIFAAFPPQEEPHASPQSCGGKILLPAGVPTAAAEKFVEHRYLYDAARGLHYYRGEFFEWKKTHYQSRVPDALRAELYKFLSKCVVLDRNGKPVPFNPTSSKVSGILDALESGCFQNERRELPFWLAKDLKDLPRTGWLACRNGLVDLSTREDYDHTPLYFNTVALPYEFDPDAPEPKHWLQFLEELWPDDPESQQLLGEIFGYALSADTSQQKIFLLVGPTRGGKGTIGRVLTALLGNDNAVSPTLASFTGEFGMQPLIGKRLALITDARLGTRNVSIVIERLLSISGEDSMTINRKYLNPWTGRLGTRIIVLTNEMPQLPDASGALAGRFVILQLHKSFYGKEDPKLYAKLLKERPGILNWALDGRDRLRKRGHFEMPRASQEAVRIMGDLASPVRAFVRDWCELDPSFKVTRKELFAAHKKWCEQEGYRAGSAEGFGKRLKAAFPQINTKGKLHGEHAYIGIDLTDKARDEVLNAPESGRR